MFLFLCFPYSIRNKLKTNTHTQKAASGHFVGWQTAYRYSSDARNGTFDRSFDLELLGATWSDLRSPRAIDNANHVLKYFYLHEAGRTNVLEKSNLQTK